jgi:acetyltransferase-like isoleucine patch superfamily enzyme
MGSRLLQVLQFQLKHSKISWRAKISGKVVLLSSVEVGPRSFIIDSTLKKGVFIFNDSVINESVINDHCKVSNNVSINKSELGTYSYVSENCRISNSTIGKFCSIGPGVTIAGGKHPVSFLSTSPVWYSTSRQNGTTFSDKNYFEESSPVTIGNDVWIGTSAYISDGVRIGNGAIIGAGAVITKDVAPFSVVGGVPAKEIKKRFSYERIEAIEKIKWWEWNEEKLIRNRKLFRTPDFDLDEIQ